MERKRGKSISKVQVGKSTQFVDTIAAVVIAVIDETTAAILIIFSVFIFFYLKG